MIKIGPTGLGPVKEAISNLEEYKTLGFSCCEVLFTYGVYIDKEEAETIGKKAKELGIKLSIHAPYWVNLNSADKKKVAQSRKRILDSCEIGNYLGAYRIVFHPGFYAGIEKGETYNNIRNEIIKIQETIKENGWLPRLAPETTGKKNVFGSVDEILQLVKDTGCAFCIDFAHILAREGKVDYKEILGKFSQYKEMHIHFSGIEYGEKGEKKHKKTEKKDIKELIESLKKYAAGKEITIINESPFAVEDSLETLKML
jgi:deoxyribonuclease IV